MKIVINENPSLTETEIIINCARADAGINRILAALRDADTGPAVLSGLKDGKTHKVEPSDVLYFETADKRTFIYTADEVFESGLRLYEIEERMKPGRFFRVSKSTIINIARIKTIVPDFGGRLEVTMQNDERLFVSRQYANGLKILLGMRGSK